MAIEYMPVPNHWRIRAAAEDWFTRTNDLCASRQDGIRIVAGFKATKGAGPMSRCLRFVVVFPGGREETKHQILEGLVLGAAIHEVDERWPPPSWCGGK